MNIFEIMVYYNKNVVDRIDKALEKEWDQLKSNHKDLKNNKEVKNNNE